MIKVADFGLAESIDPTKDYFRQDQNVIIKLPVKWLALESIIDGVFSEKSDVVSMNKWNAIAFLTVNAIALSLQLSSLSNRSTFKFHSFSVLAFSH